MKTKEKLKSEELNKAASILKKGGIVIFPTDTVYGIGCIWNNNIAITRIQKIKNSSQNFPILIHSQSQLHALAKVTGPAQELINRFWPGGLTLLLEGKNHNKKIGIRMPKSDIVQSLITLVGSPLVGTSANFHGQQTPTSYENLDQEFIKKADYVVVGDCQLQKESTVVDATVIPLKILREGADKVL